MSSTWVEWQGGHLKWFMNKLISIVALLLVLASCTSTQPIKKLSHQQAIEAMLNDSSIVLVDVRTPQEFNEGHVSGAINIPLDTIETSFESQFQDKNVQLFIICRSGNRSAQAAVMLQKLGYTDITDIGGIINWPQPLVQP